MKKYFILITILCSQFILQKIDAQETNIFSAEGQPKTIARLHFFSLGFSAEHEISPKATILGDISYGWENSSGENTDEWIFVPYFRVEPRYFFNLDRRQEKGKRTDYFSGQFVTFQTKIGIPVGYTNHWYSFGPQWGFQRTLGRRGYWSFQIGPVIEGQGSEIRTNFKGDFSIGFILN